MGMNDPHLIPMGFNMNLAQRALWRMGRATYLLLSERADE